MTYRQHAESWGTDCREAVETAISQPQGPWSDTAATLAPSFAVYAAEFAHKVQAAVIRREIDRTADKLRALREVLNDLTAGERR